MEKTRSGRFICKYVEYGASPITLLADTEEEAYRKLLSHLEKKAKDGDPEPPLAA